MSLQKNNNSCFNSASPGTNAQLENPLCDRQVTCVLTYVCPLFTKLVRCDVVQSTLEPMLRWIQKQVTPTFPHSFYIGLASDKINIESVKALKYYNKMPLLLSISHLRKTNQEYIMLAKIAAYLIKRLMVRMRLIKNYFLQSARAHEAVLHHSINTY